MIRKTLANARDPSQCGIAQVANVSPTDDRFAALINLAIQNLVQTGEMFYGLYQSVQFCVTSSCLVLPRQIAGIEAIAVCDNPITVRNRWYEYIGGVGLRSSNRSEGPNWGCGSCGGEGLIDRGETCCFADIIGTNKRVKVYADVAESGSAKILLLGYDENNQWIRTETYSGSGIWQDGEYVSISTTPTLSTKFFSALTGVQKPFTNGTVRLYEYDTTLTTQRAIAIYEPSETNPAYRKMLISGLGAGHCSEDDDDTDDTTQVTVMAKLEFVPVSKDTDWLLIGNFNALESEVQSILKRRNNLADESLTWHAMAIQTLRQELRHYTGRGVVNPMRMQSRNLAGAGVRSVW